ncbi:sigma subunit of AP-1 complex [Chloropicon primus]|nr:sigma subunit of AP-1 complex [Chloropicon primus]
MIHFVLLQNRQGKSRLNKWYSKQTPGEEDQPEYGPYDKREKARIIREVSGIVAKRKGRVSNFVEYGDMMIVYRRYAGLYFIFGIDKGDNPLIILDLIHMFVEVLDSYFGSVCELDLVYNFHRAYYILDELILAGHHQARATKVCGFGLDRQAGRHAGRGVRGRVRRVLRHRLIHNSWAGGQCTLTKLQSFV